jgi:hypothetical protein
VSSWQDLPTLGDAPRRDLSKPLPSVVTKGRRRKDAESALDAAYAEVDRRDGPTCRVTGRYTQPGAVDPRVRREHHHLEPRSLAKQRIADPKNIVVVCKEAHDLFKAGWLVSEGDNANKPVRFHWTALAPKHLRPFEILSRRKSQRKDMD